MSLADQIGELEEELEHYQQEASKLSSLARELENELDDITRELEKATRFIEFVDKTSPELSAAYQAATVLEGDKP